MGKNSRQGRRRGKSQAQAARQRMYAHMVVLLLTFTFIIGGAFWLFHGKKIGAHATASPMPRESAAAPEARAGFDSLKGRWLRPDGGYVMEIRGIDARAEKWRPHTLIPDPSRFPGRQPRRTGQRPQFLSNYETRTIRVLPIP